eukprot:TRINITY_DN12769_c0_g2_i5.p1 TRINITY_DN12769_c0_g2~~TRINITY_DN12769_c0_g2_i5.p1  ORF type:complete len:190 (-),score=33.67 TRINITY_DN12769_c0_g2_i5:66-635(-)
MDIDSLRRGDLNIYLQQIKVLQDQKQNKIREQNERTQRLNNIVRKYESDSKRVIKNLEAAVAKSNQPGDINYVLPAERNLDDCKSLIEEIGKIEEEMKEIDQKIAQVEAKKRAEYSQVHEISSFDEWFRQNGRPKLAAKGFVSEFKPPKRRVPHFGVDDMSGTITLEKLKSPQPLSGAKTMVRGWIGKR